MHRLFLAILLAFGFVTSALAQSDFQRYALTVPMVEKFNAANRDLKKSVKEQKDDDDMDGKSVEQIAKELDAIPGVKPVLARHGFTSKSFALTALAMFQAGFYLAMEPSMDKKKGASLLASYPSETRANIELLRKNPQLLK